MPAPTPLPPDAVLGAHDRPDRCPGALRPFAARDGLVARVRLAGAPLTPEQARGIADLADDLGDGHVGLTSRANVQVRGLDEDGVARFADAAAGLGLLPSSTHERARNLVVSPTAGDDVLDLARALDREICADPALAGLSGRFLVGIDDGTGHLLRLPLDVAAQVRDGALACSVAGLSVLLGEPVAAPLVEVLRMVGSARSSAGDTTGWNVADLSDGARTRLRDELAGRFTTTAPLRVAADAPRLAGPLPGGQLAATAPLGTISSAGWRAAADLAATTGRRVRVTPWHAVVLDGAAGVGSWPELASTGWVLDPSSPWLDVHACTGLPDCARSLADVRAAARAVVEAGYDGRRGPLMISGCARTCGHPSVPHTSAVALDARSYLLGRHDGTHGPQDEPQHRTDDLLSAIAAPTAATGPSTPSRIAITPAGAQ